MNDMLEQHPLYNFIAIVLKSPDHFIPTVIKMCLNTYAKLSVQSEVRRMCQWKCDIIKTG